MGSSIEFIKEFVTKLKTEEKVGASRCYHIAPDIEQKKLTNATTRIAKQIDPSTVLGIYDSTLFESAKEGLVFTGSKLFISYMGSKNEITLEQVAKCNLCKEEIVKEDKTEIKEYLLIENKDESIINIAKFQCPLGLEVIDEFLNGLLETITDFKEVKQNVLLQELDDEIIQTYLEVVTAYLYCDDMQIDETEYKQLIALMSKNKISKDVAQHLRELRLNPTVEQLNLEQLIGKLHIQLEEHKIDQTFINQGLYLDLLCIRSENLEETREDEILLECKQLLNISDAHVDTLMKKIEGDKRIIEERLDNNQVKEVTEELTAVAASSGVVLGALLLTGGVGTGVWGGLMTLAMASTGGMAFGMVAIGGLGYGAYKGLKYFSGTTESEKYGVRLSTLETVIENNKRGLTYVIEDVNWILGKMSGLTEKMKKSDDQSDEIMDELMDLINKSCTISEAGKSVEMDNEKYKYEINICAIPQKLNYDQFEQLISSNYRAEEIKEKVLNAYVKEENVVDEKIIVTYTRAEELEYAVASEVYEILKSIGMFNAAEAGQARLQSATKKGLSTMKSFLGN